MKWNMLNEWFIFKDATTLQVMHLWPYFIMCFLIWAKYKLRCSLWGDLNLGRVKEMEFLIEKNTLNRLILLLNFPYV